MSSEGGGNLLDESDHEPNFEIHLKNEHCLDLPTNQIADKQQSGEHVVSHPCSF